MKVLAFAASNSRQSINKALVSYAVTLLETTEVEILDLNDYELPLFSIDTEAELGQPVPAKNFMSKIADCDALVIAFAEHNGYYSAAYKNLFDWCSRIDKNLYQNKPAILLSTSPGARGGATVLAAALEASPRFGANIKGSLAIPSFYDNFDQASGKLSNVELQQQLTALMADLQA